MRPSRRQVLMGTAAFVCAGPGGGTAAHAAPAPGAPGARTADFAALARSLDGRVVLPSDTDYAEARQLFQPRYDTVAPGAVAYPAHAEDVAACLAFVRRTGVPVVARGGGHGYAGWSTGPGLVIDVGVLAYVAAGSAGAVRIGAGARLADVGAALADRGTAIPTGLCPSVGIAGLTLGGGLGISSRAYGATSDQLTGARLVTPDGVVREVDATHEPELFWALRGGGAGNFGVVTEFRFRSHPVTDCAFAELHWPWRHAAAALRGWQRWLAALPDPFWSQVEFVIESGRRPDAAVRVVCLDGRAELERQLTRLADLIGVPARDSHVTVHPYAATLRALAGCEGRAAAECRLPGQLPGRDPRGRLGRDSYAARSDFWPVAGLPEPAVDAVLDAISRYAADGRGVVQFDGVCGGALNRVGARDTAFVHRDSGLLAQYLAYWPESAQPQETGRQQAWLDDLWTGLRPWASGGAYQNYADPRLASWRQACYGVNLPRLEQVKRTVDPDRMFSFPQGV
ncbi:FAD-binding oxidoreductase [Streptomyces sp. NPDC090022]|uniref:FAD-binding oxidoreductase n=1 Tax=Streptomyces sp. NPDC090022 TaxID=3365920 RepID=UPI0038068BB3